MDAEDAKETQGAQRVFRAFGAGDPAQIIILES
jgi:hypothetical protein